MPSIHKKKIFPRDDYRCVYCGKDLRNVADPNERHRDHIVPVKEGGDDIASNIATACRDCNTPGRVTKSQRQKARSGVAQRNRSEGIPQNAKVTGLGPAAASQRRRRRDSEAA